MWLNLARCSVVVALSAGFVLWSAADQAQGCGKKMKTQTPSQSTVPSNLTQSTGAQQSALLRLVEQTSAAVAATQPSSAPAAVGVSASFASTSSSLTVAQQQENLVIGLQNMLKRQHGQLKPYQIHSVRQRELSIRKQLGTVAGNGN